MPRHSVALLIETSNGYCRGMLDGIIAFAKHQADWSMHLNEQERGAKPPSWLGDWQGNGIIARIETDAIGQDLKQLKVPIVDLSAARHLPGIPWADTDDHAIAALAIGHFEERDFRNVAFCGDPGFEWSVARRDHFRELAMITDKHYFEHQVTHRYASDFALDEVKQSLGKWLVQTPKPLGIMACNDFQAQQILDVCRTLRIAVPEQVAVLGVDNDRLICELCEPSLSSIKPDTYRTGYEAAELLERMMLGQPVEPRARLITQPLGVQLRQSTDTIAIEDENVAKALSFIRRRACEGIRVMDVVKQTDLSRRALEHRFAKLVGKTPHEEIDRVRVARILELLRETEDSVLSIASRTGFDYPEYMSATFRRHMGMSPTEYRRRNASQPETSH